MFRKLVDVLKEVFWIKPSHKKPKSTKQKSVKKSPSKKKTVKKAPKSTPKPKVTSKLPKPKVAAKSKASVIDPSLVQVGVITHYFDRIKVAVIKLTQGTILIGDKLTILGPKTKLAQKVWSMQIESSDVKVAKKGQVIGIKVDKLVVVGDKVYK